MTEQEKIHRLTWSENGGHYALDDPETGQEVGYGPLSIEVLDEVWVDGHIVYSTNYEGPGCYQIADSGRPHPEAGAPGSVTVELRVFPAPSPIEAVDRHGEDDDLAVSSFREPA